MVIFSYGVIDFNYRNGEGGKNILKKWGVWEKRGINLKMERDKQPLHTTLSSSVYIWACKNSVGSKVNYVEYVFTQNQANSKFSEQDKIDIKTHYMFITNPYA